MGHPLTAGSPRAAEIVGADDEVLVAIKTPLMPRSVKVLMPSGLTLDAAVARLRTMTKPGDPDARRVLEQIDRETSASNYHFLVVSTTGGIVNTPRNATIGSIASPREVRTPQGLKTVQSVAVEVQAYAPVGGRER